MQIKKRNSGFVLLIGLILSACAQVVGQVETSVYTDTPTRTFQTVTLTPNVSLTITPQPTSTLPVNQDFSISVSSLIPESFQKQIQNPFLLNQTQGASESSLMIDILNKDKKSPVQSDWVYVMVAPFSTVMDEVSLWQILQTWRGKGSLIFNGNPILIDEETLHIFENLWGQSSPDGIEVVSKQEILDHAWKTQPSWALIPFEELSPKWKVLYVDGLNPLDKTMDIESYPLSVHFGILGEEETLHRFVDWQQHNPAVLPETNRDIQKMTVLVMTGTTALVRYTAQKMEQNGVLYPARDIGPWLLQADITHISNEAPFYTLCPPADPVRIEARFCSDPKYFALLQEVGTDVIELTGNHVLDWGYDPFLYTLNVYKENKLPYYGGGKGLAEARKPYLLEDHGNKIAFLGCNVAGPEEYWATSSTPGPAPCNWKYIDEQIKTLKKEGYLVVFTFQHIEVEQFEPHSSQRIDFMNVASMGADIVSGSQSHFPQAMTFSGESFIHYGLGNLFFDQMYGYNPHEFIDRHVFYDGKYISTELLSAMLEDSAKPRPMTFVERKAFLNDVFATCKW